MRGITAAVLVFEGMVVFFATLVARSSSDLDNTLVWWAGGGLALTFWLVAGVLGRPGGYLVGSAMQVVLVGTGFVVPAMFFLGAIFAGLWFLALHLGRKVERARAAGAAPTAK